MDTKEKRELDRHITREDRELGPDHRYTLQYGELHGFPNEYVVVDWEDRRPGKVVLHSKSKSTAIKRCQELNGFEPADGDEGTYGRQIL